MIAEQDLFKACHVLFGREVSVSRGFLQYLQLTGIKSAYRSKARETHPDMMVGNSDFDKLRSAELFQQVQQAYESLTSYLDARERGLVFFKANSPPPYRRPAQKTYQHRTASAKKPAWATKNGHSSTSSNNGAGGRRPGGDAAWRWQQGAARQTTTSRQIPARKLLFGHYLYYCGITNWQTIIKALVWQRTERPRLGEIGKRFGWLTNQDIFKILRERELSCSFGRSAVDMGLITENQLRLMVFQQNRLQKKIGDYYIQNNLLSPYKLNLLIQQFRFHNSAVGAARRAS